MTFNIPSNDLAAALDTPSRACEYSREVLPRATEPGTLRGETGYHRLAGEPGGAGPARVAVVPYCGGGAGRAFGMKIHGVRQYGRDEAKRVWVEAPLVEVWCWAGDIPGPPKGLEALPERLIGPQENFCEHVMVVGGSLGLGSDAGMVYSFGAGSGYVAWFDLAVRGWQWLHFDFVSEDNLPKNALWARA